MLFQESAAGTQIQWKSLGQASGPALSQPGRPSGSSGHFFFCAPLRQNHTLFSDPEISAAPASSINVRNLLSRGSKSVLQRPPSQARGRRYWIWRGPHWGVPGSPRIGKLKTRLRVSPRYPPGKLVSTRQRIKSLLPFQYFNNIEINSAISI